MSLKNKGTRAGFDPRTKLLLLVLVILSASTAPSLRYELGLVSLIALFALLCGRWKLAAGGMAFYGVIYLLSLAAAAMEPSAWQAVFLAFFGLIHKVYPCRHAGGTDGGHHQGQRVPVGHEPDPRAEEAGHSLCRHAPVHARYPGKTGASSRTLCICGTCRQPWEACCGIRPERWSVSTCRSFRPRPKRRTSFPSPL